MSEFRIDCRVVSSGAWPQISGFPLPTVPFISTRAERDHWPAFFKAFVNVHELVLVAVNAAFGPLISATNSTNVMAIATFLPAAAANHLRRLVHDEELWIANDWRELDLLASDARITAVVLDPGADGRMNVESVVHLMGDNPSVPVFAYVPATPWHLKAIFKLSKHGLTDVFLHPILRHDLRLATVVNRVGANRIAFDFLGRLETRLAKLPPEIFRAIQDLFQRPHRYESVAGRRCGASASISQETLSACPVGSRRNADKAYYSSKSIKRL